MPLRYARRIRRLWSSFKLMTLQMWQVLFCHLTCSSSFILPFLKFMMYVARKSYHLRIFGVSSNPLSPQYGFVWFVLKWKTSHWSYKLSMTIFEYKTCILIRNRFNFFLGCFFYCFFLFLFFLFFFSRGCSIF